MKYEIPELSPEHRAFMIERRREIYALKTYDELVAWAKNCGYSYPEIWAKKHMEMRAMRESKRATQ